MRHLLCMGMLKMFYEKHIYFPSDFPSLIKYLFPPAKLQGHAHVMYIGFGSGVLGCRILEWLHLLRLLNCELIILVVLLKECDVMKGIIYLFTCLWLESVSSERFEQVLWLVLLNKTCSWNYFKR